MVVVLQLDVIEVTVPVLIGKTAIQVRRAEHPRAPVADFIAVHVIVPTVGAARYQRIGGGFGDLGLAMLTTASAGIPPLGKCWPLAEE